MSETRPEQAATATSARAACEAFWTVIRTRMGVKADPADAWAWAASEGALEAWEAAARAVAPALTGLLATARQLRDEAMDERDRLTGRVDGLVTEVNNLRRERDRYRAALERLLGATEYEPDDSEFAGLVDDIARDALGSDWPSAVVTAGTEHLVPLIRGLAIPDEER